LRPPAAALGVGPAGVALLRVLVRVGLQVAGRRRRGQMVDAAPVVCAPAGQQALTCAPSAVRALQRLLQQPVGQPARLLQPLRPPSGPDLTDQDAHWFYATLMQYLFLIIVNKTMKLAPRSGCHSSSRGAIDISSSSNSYTCDIKKHFRACPYCHQPETVT
jgi:hypothetical protein